MSEEESEEASQDLEIYANSIFSFPFSMHTYIQGGLKIWSQRIFIIGRYIRRESSINVYSGLTVGVSEKIMRMAPPPVALIIPDSYVYSFHNFDANILERLGKIVELYWRSSENFFDYLKVILRWYENWRGKN